MYFLTRQQSSMNAAVVEECHKNLAIGSRKGHVSLVESLMMGFERILKVKGAVQRQHEVVRELAEVAMSPNAAAAKFSIGRDRRVSLA